MKHQSKFSATKGKVYKFSIAAATVLMSINTAWATVTCQHGTGSRGAPTSVGGVDTCYTGNLHPHTNDDKAGQVLVTGGEEVLLKARPGSSIVQGDSDPYAEATDTSLFKVTRNNIPLADPANHIIIELGEQNSQVQRWDPISSSFVTYSTFSSVGFKDGKLHGKFVIPIAKDPDGQYIDTRFATATGAGSKVKVDLTDYGQDINMSVKQSSLFMAENGGAIEWEGKNRVYTARLSNASPYKFSGGVNIHNYQNQTVDFLGKSYTINNIDDLRRYNDDLVAALKNGTFPLPASGRSAKDYEQAYKDQLMLAIPTELIWFEQKNDPAIAGRHDGIEKNRYKRILHADGNGSTIKMKDGSVLVSYYQAEGMRVEGGATGIIEEGARLSGYSRNVTVNGAGSTFTNNGVISAGFSAFDPKADSTGYVIDSEETVDGPYHWDTAGAAVNDGGTFTNNGILNVSTPDAKIPHDAYGINLNGATAENTGTINVAINNNGRGPEVTTSGVRIAEAVCIARLNGSDPHCSTDAEKTSTQPSTFTNSGTIYIGRAAQQEKNALAVETEESKSTYGIWHKKQATVTLKSTSLIQIGKRIENSIAYYLDEEKNSTVTFEDGSRMILGGNRNLTNWGLLARNTGGSTINANGNIKITGSNTRAIEVQGDSTVNVGTTGVVEVDGGFGSGTRNYGVYAEGTENNVAKVNFNGKAILAGKGAIGLHARGHSNIVNGGEVKMESGSDQIGYFIYGPDADIKVKPTVMGVDTDRSTMFRLAGGAKFDASGFTINTKGVGSNAITVTGSDEVSGQKSKANTVGGTFNLNGVNSNFLKVEGGAQAALDYTSKVTLGARGVTIGIVDGESYDLFKKPEAGKLKDDSRLDSSLSTSSSLEGVNAYITRSRGNLDYNGSYINLYGSDSVGFKMQDGGRLKIAESASFIVNGDAIRSEEQNDESGLNRGETNTARLERNEINAINVLNARSGAVTVDSRGQSLLTGAALTDANANSRLSLSEETVWNITDNSKLTTLINRGTMNFVGQITDPKDRKQYQQLEIAGDYLGVGGSTLSVNSNWYQTEGVFTNTVVIKGDATGQTRVIATDGIGGDVKAPQAGETGSGIEMLADNRFLKYDAASPVISVLGSDNFDNGNPTFVGDAVIRDSAEQVQLIKKGRHYYWAMTGVLPAKESQKEEAKPVDTGKKIYVPETSAYLQTPYINRQQSFDLLGKLTDRVGEQQFDCDCLGPQSWSRLSYHDGYSQGKNRFGFGSKRGLVQFGQDLSFNMNETRRVHTGISVGYSWSQNRFYDKYRSENGYISADKETLGSKSQVVGLGLYRTAYFANGSYLDLNLNGNWIHNQYKTDNRHHKPSQNGYSLGASVETGRLFKLGESHWYVQPQVQLRAQYQHLNRFKDGSRQTEAKAQTGLQARLGARLTNGTFHVSADLVHDIIAPKTAVTIGNSRLEERYNPTTAELAVGGDIGLDSNGKWKLYSDAKYTRALGKANNVFGKKAPAESYNARIGVRYSW